MAKMSGSFSIEKADDIFDLPDMMTGMKFLKQWGISTKGVKNTKGAIELLLENCKFREDVARETIEMVTSGLKEAIVESKRNRDGLIRSFEEMLSIYRQLPTNHQASLNKVFPSLENTTNKKIKELRSNECAVLIAGESVAGKSSFINLLVGVDLLPTSQLSCSATFCELRYSSKKYAVCCTKEGKKTKIDLSTSEGMEELKQQIAYITDDVDDNENEKVEVYWPFDILEDGIVIIDTPGIGTSKDMTEKIQQYLENAFGCIYVINSASAGGVQKGRIMDFLRTVMNLSEEQFNPQTTMFVCNKWEQVPTHDKDEVMKSNNYKLRQCYPDFRADQVYYLSTDRAKQALPHGLILQDHKAILRGINKLLPASLENKHEAYYRWLSTVLKRTQFILKVSKYTRRENIENLKIQIQNIEKQMYNLQQNAKASIRKLQEEVQNEADGLHYKVINLLSSQDFLPKITQWEPSQCPQADKKWKKVSGSASEVIAQRLTQEINNWERRNGIKASIKDKIIGRFKRDFELMEDQINDIEGMFLGDETRILADLQKTIRGPRNKKDKMKGKGDKQNMVGIGGAVAVLGTLGKESKDVLRKYKRDNCHLKMAEVTNLYIQNILKSKELKENLSRFVQRYAKGIDKIAELIPDFLEADRQMLASLKVEAEQTKADSSPACLQSCISLQSGLDLFYVDSMMHVDYQLSDIDCNWDDKLGQGSFAEVFFGVLNSNDGSKHDVALKRSRDIIDKKSVTDILLEDRTMRDAKHENFIAYHGNALQRMKGGKTYWVMIMEYCAGSLKDVFVDNHSQYKIENPANCRTISEKESAFKEMSVFGVQLCQGLDYLHSKKLVHRDLKLENVLFTQKKIVKLTDVGLTKPEIDISGTMTGSPVYMAPEVLIPKGVYNKSADVYSLGIMIWEMWYGIDAADHIGPRIMKTIEADVTRADDPLRPLMNIHQKPDGEWIKLIERCWSPDSSKRPSAAEVLKFFKNV
ncbi:uncharacterized protein LOC143066936 isoform X1 [Mytilus galloprovincialis]|uniref:uncharacterized protein LOC143066936 isoform X1 n=1 Tax=Mytilus galloprovincialis TaxID=29158 RepID=UPI003F7CA3B0